MIDERRNGYDPAGSRGCLLRIEKWHVNCHTREAKEHRSYTATYIDISINSNQPGQPTRRSQIPKERQSPWSDMIRSR